MKKHLEQSHLKFRSLLKDMQSMKVKLSRLEKIVKYYSDVYPSKSEFRTMKKFLADLKAKKSKAFIPLEAVKRK
jgi:hypothetical protein